MLIACDDHPTNEVTSYCKNCQTLICDQCFRTTHKIHLYSINDFPQNKLSAYAEEATKKV